MPVNKFPVKKVVILVLLVVCFAIGCCKRSKAETVIIGPDMPPTFDPNMGLDTPVPEPTEDAEPSESPEPVDEDPSFPPLLAPGANLRIYNMPGLIWYDETADAFKLKRAYGSVTTVTLPFSLSACPSQQSAATTSADGSIKTYSFSMESSLIQESTTSHYFGKGLFQFYFYNIFNAGQVVSPNALYYTFDLNDFRLYCDDPAYTYFPSYQVLTYVYYGTSNSNITTRDVITSEVMEWSNDGMSKFISVDVPNTRPGLSILGVSIRVRFGSIDVFNGFPVEDPVRSVVEPTYYYDCNSYSATVVWAEDQSYHNKETKSIISSIGGFFTDLWHNYTTFFMPDSEMLTEWIEEHAIDPDEDNPLLVVRGLFQSILQMFSSSENLRTPVFQIPALTFTVGGQTVTPFTGYQFNLQDADIPISGGTTLFYWSRLFGTMGVITGFIGLLWSYFSKFFDAHYAKGIIEAGGDE